ncbi:hypothetical protein K1T71_004655 [Dendrolimus kikuchii]|uniref:Uncharacterized protein n=1 Tax=Dendrolimus kikuchii TaxID=765133 RepID=A0ACC1D7W7_9NEOP|nr:hypothetical protein K1T71_004655 [Dendrolimus kikuchii]
MRVVIVVVLFSLVALAASLGPVKCTREHEHYECGSACQTTCQRLGQPCPIVNFRCNDRCYCDFGYARDSSGKCIPIHECPKK